MEKIILPHHFKRRPYQKVTFDAFFKKRYKRFIDIEHRRAGKDKKWLNIICAAAQERVGTYIHTFPKLSQAKKAIWKGMDYEGFRFIDHFPKELIAKINNVDMAIEFKNGSIYQLLGADNYNTYMGANPVGIVFSEYALQDPDAWRYFEPMVLENDGWVAFIYTPRGKNHGYQLYETNKNNPAYFTQLLSINDTYKSPGVPIYSEEQIDEIRKAGTPEELIQQEYYCSFTSAIMGAYYSAQMRQLEEDNHIRSIPIEPHLPVHTFWDLGVNDSTFIWFMQTVNDEYRFIHCYENQNEGMPHYVNYLHQFREQKRIVYGNHYAPHDIAVRELGTGKTRSEAAAQLGLRFEEPVKRPRNGQELLEEIHVVRMTLPKCWFDEEGCKRGIRCLNEYSKDWDDKNKIFKNSPKHDWTSHGADAFRTFAMAFDQQRYNQPMQIMFNRVNQGPI